MSAVPESVINLLVQVPLVGIFVWFILQRDKQTAESEKRRDEQWRDFLREERELRATSIGRLAEELKSIGQEVARVTALLVSHDAKASIAIEKIVRSDKEE